MKIVLKRKWMNHNRGETLDIAEHIAARLVRWGTAREYDKKRDGKKPSKSMSRAPADKMLAGAPVDK